MRKKIIAGNWKLYNNRPQTAELIGKIIALTNGANKVDIAVAPPFTSLQTAKESIGKSGLILVAQNVFHEEKGAFTGEISPTMLKEIGCTMVIIGHSERRQLFGETDDSVNRKIKASLSAGLLPIVCVGESLQERESDKTFNVLTKQLFGAFKEITEMDKIVIAYEPVWAIGTGRNATKEQAQEVHAFIRSWVEKNSGHISKSIRIIYGGSVKPSNAAELMACQDVDGALVGGASLIAEDFNAIIRHST
jgi:triosephosphate isomerase